MMNRQTNLIFILISISLCRAQRKIIETDNIAVEQHGAPLFAIPVSGLRFTPQSGANLKTRFEAFSNSLDSGVVGHLMPLDPSQSMPQMTSLDVGCYHDKMEVNIRFDNPFNGMIYSKGYYDVEDCIYLHPNSNQREIRFELKAQGCGMQFIEPPGKSAFMENVVIIQNEPSIQEIWDTARGIRCMFDGTIGRLRNRHTVTAALNVAMLEQQVVTFASSAKASAFMDIQVGRGPFAPSASGLVKIGELMTMVVEVEGPSEMDVLVRQCIAHDGTNDNTIDLTDDNGCVIKKKIIGSWQKKRDIEKSNTPVMAYAHFQAFKFPDKMDVYIECEVDLCNGQCPVCSEDQPDLKKRKRRALPPDMPQNEPIPDFESAVDELINKLKDRKDTRNDLKSNDNKTENAALRLARKLRVLSPDDISFNGDEYSSFTLVTKTSNGRTEDDVCMSLASFVIGIIVMLVVLIASSVLTAVLCIRVRTIPSSESSFPPDSSFHAFSTVSGKTT